MTEEQISEHKELGLDEQMIERLKNMPTPQRKGGGPDSQAPGGNTPADGQDSSNQASTSNYLVLALSFVALLAALVLVLKFNGRVKNPAVS